MKDLRYALIFLTILTILVCSGSVRAVTALWDQSHEPLGGFELNDGYAQLQDLLLQMGYDLQANDGPLLEQGLWNVDILVISILSNYDRAYTEEEADRIASFVAGGGGLIVLADNTESNPENIAPVLNRFNLLSAQNDALGDLIRFENHPINNNLQSLFILEGSAVGFGNQDNHARLISFDVDNLAGAAVWQDHAGLVVLVGDADIWANDVINEEDNMIFALNCFQETSRLRLGVIEQSGENEVLYLVPDDETSYTFDVFNRGEAPLEIGVAAVGAADWIQAGPRYAVIQIDSSQEITVTISSADLQPDQQQAGVLRIMHNDPNLDPVNLNITLNVIDVIPRHFSPPNPTGRDHSLLIGDLTLDGVQPRAGIEVAVFTPEGACAGASVYPGHLPMGVIARADDPFTEEVEGFLDGDVFTFRMWVPWLDREIAASAVYLNGVSEFRTDGFSVLNLLGGEAGRLDLEFDHRWSIISLNVTPNRLEMPRIFEPLVESGNLFLVKDGEGHFWNLEFDFSNLGPWDITSGYEVGVIHPCEMSVTGVVINPQTPIQVEPGWSIIAYFPAVQIAPAEALQTIIDDLIIIKRDDGAFYNPEWEFDGIGAMEPGKGYKVSMTGRSALVYPEAGERLDEARAFPSIPPQSRFNHSLLLSGLKPGTPARVLNESGLVNSRMSADGKGRLGIPVWGDDPDTDVIEGLSEGNSFRVQQLNGDAWRDLEVAWLKGGNCYRTDGFSVGQARAVLPPTELDITCLPNPFNSVLRVRIQAAGEASVSVFDVEGRRLASRQLLNETGSFSTLYFASDGWSAGVVFIRLESEGHTVTRKALHLP